ncbi:ras-related protein Rab-13 [Trichonephila clavata]|uniref:Ras-related protein Rab-13 n=1 Tax=Trichonephila clavata TaxID=2740835 RepID=A0A8X6LB25_TRICU|nr:ras-related protein Rab-13 [Trichonephila clavata]
MAVEEFKVILVGESGVGKTSFVIRFADSRFQNVYESTVGVDCKKFKSLLMKLQLFCKYGHSRTREIFRSADGAIIVYDVTKKETFDEVPWWIKETKQHLTGIPIFLGE